MVYTPAAVRNRTDGNITNAFLFADGCADDNHRSTRQLPGRGSEHGGTVVSSLHPSFIHFISTVEPF